MLYLSVETLSMRVAIVAVSQVGFSIVGNEEFEYMASRKFSVRG